jgi:hypothetical protein
MFIARFDDHLLWYTDCSTSNIYITTQQDLIISYCQNAFHSKGSSNVKNCGNLVETTFESGENPTCDGETSVEWEQSFQVHKTTLKLFEEELWLWPFIFAKCHVTIVTVATQCPGCVCMCGHGHFDFRKKVLGSAF